MHMKITDIPKEGIGPLQGLKVVVAGGATAGPFAGTMMSDFGASVIHIESPAMFDTNRLADAYEQDHRNQRGLALDVPSPKGKEIFAKLIKDTDIFIESSKGGQWAKWGLTDEALWEINKALVIVHVSGFGQEGDPEYIKRPSWDGVGLAFGGITFQNGSPETPLNIGPYFCDGITAMYASWGALAAVIHAKKTGQGESLDIAQFEPMIRSQSGGPYRYFQYGIVPKRLGSKNNIAAAFRNFKCSNGYIFIGLAGPAILPKGLAFFGYEIGTPGFPKGFLVPQGTPQAEMLENTIAEYCAQRTVEEVDAALVELGVPCAPLMTYEMARNNSHYKAREVFTEWETREGKTVFGVNCLPRMKNNPGRVWNGAPGWGEDTRDILEELGFCAEDIDALYEAKVVR